MTAPSQDSLLETELTELHGLMDMAGSDQPDDLAFFLERHPDEVPCWLRLCMLVARLAPDEELLDRLRQAIPGIAGACGPGDGGLIARRLDGIRRHLLRHRLPPEDQPTEGDLSDRLLGQWVSQGEPRGHLNGISRSSAPWSAAAIDPTAPRCVIPLALVSRATGVGIRAELTLVRLDTPGIHVGVEFVPAPASCLVPLGIDFVESFRQVRACLDHFAAPTASLNGVVLAWDIRPVDEPIGAIVGNSAGGALALGAAWLLRTQLQSDLRCELARIRGTDLYGKRVSTALIDVQGRFGIVGAIASKAEPIRPMDRTYRIDDRLIVGDDQPDIHGSHVLRLPDLTSLIQCIAQEVDPLTPQQKALHQALLLSDDAGDLDATIIGVVAAQPAVTLRQYLLKRWAKWGKGDGEQQLDGERLGQLFVRLGIDPDSREDPRPRDPPPKLAFTDVQQFFDAGEGFLERNAFVLRGPPGAGKTTLLRRREMHLCRKALIELAADAGREVPVPLYLALADLPDKATEAMAWASEWLAVELPGDEASWLRSMLLGQAARPGRLHLLLDGLNEVKPTDTQPDGLRRAVEVASALQRALCVAWGPAAMPLNAEPILLSLRTHHPLPNLPAQSGLKLLHLDVKPWTRQDIADYLGKVFPVTGAGHFRDLQRSLVAVELCGNPMHLVGQCALFKEADQLLEEAGKQRTSGPGQPRPLPDGERPSPVVMEDRAALMCAWLWIRLSRGEAHGGFALQRLMADRRWFSQDDIDAIRSRAAWLGGPRLRGLPDDGLFLRLVYRQADRHWRSQARAGSPADQRGGVAVGLADVRSALLRDCLSEGIDPAKVDGAVDSFLDALRDLGLAEVDRAHRRFRFAHQAWGEFLCSRNLLPPTPPADPQKLQRLLAELEPPPLRDRDRDALRELQDSVQRRWAAIPEHVWKAFLEEFLAAPLRLPRQATEDALRESGFTEANLDQLYGLEFVRIDLADEDSVEVGLVTALERIDLPQQQAPAQKRQADRAAWRRLLEIMPRPLLQPVRQRLQAIDKRLLDTSTGRLTEPDDGDIDQPLALALQGQQDVLPWLRMLCLADGDAHLRAAARAAAALRHRWEGKGADLDDGALAAPVLAHLRRRLLLRNTNTGGDGKLPGPLRMAGLHADADGAWALDAGVDTDMALNTRWLAAWNSAWLGEGEDLRHRAQAGALLGNLHDAIRLAPAPALRGQGWRLKPRHWCQVGQPGQQTCYRIGDNAGRPDEAEFNIWLDAFEMAVYCVTVTEWQAFIDAGGYDDTPAETWWGADDSPERAWLRERRAWSALRDQPVQPWGWGSAAFGNGLQPVVGITWWEAVAYTRWAAPMYSHDDGLNLCLPTEAEWEAAVRGPLAPGATRQRWAGWPAVSTPDALHFNHAATRWGRVTPVGSFTNSATPAGGLADAAGNCWQWCASVYTPRLNDNWQRQPEDWTTPSDPSASRTARGGSGVNVAAYCRVGCRVHYAPDDVDSYNLGLRLARVSTLFRTPNPEPR